MRLSEKLDFTRVDDILNVSVMERGPDRILNRQEAMRLGIRRSSDLTPRVDVVIHESIN